MTVDEMKEYISEFCDHTPDCDKCPLRGNGFGQCYSAADIFKLERNVKAINEWKEEHEPNAVKHPSHYAGKGGIECIDAIRASMSTEEFCGYCKGNVLKYAWRYVGKNGVEDLEKAKVYLNWLIEAREKKAHPPEPNKKECTT